MFIFNIILKQLPSNKQTNKQKQVHLLEINCYLKKLKKKKQNQVPYIHCKMLNKKVDFDHLLQFHSEIIEIM